MIVAAVPGREDWVVMNSSCPECIRLWREYAAETIAHVKADSMLKLAVLRAERQAAREAIREHEASRHFN
jgi:hypothetical protein